MAHRYRSLVRRLRLGAPILFGPCTSRVRPGVPTDRFGRFGDARRVLVAEGETPTVVADPPDPVDVLRAEMAAHENITGSHSHMHGHGDGTTHQHSHFHNDAAVHNHAHATSKYAGLTETQRREADADNEITDPAELDALVASLLTGYEARGLTAATKPDGSTVGEAWHAYLCAEGIRTDDDRELALGACRFPDLPVSMRLLVEDEGGHWGAVTCGRIDAMERLVAQPQDGMNLIYSEGVFGSDPNGQLAELMVAEQTQRFVSVDPRDVTAEWIEVEVRRDSYDVVIYEDDDDSRVVDCWMRISDCVLGAATIVPMPAIQNAVITLASVALPDAPIATASAPPGILDIVASGLDVVGETPEGEGPETVVVRPRAVVAAAAPVAPPAEWFEDPGFHVGDPRLVLQEDGRSYACPLTITDQGQVYGHVAWWNCNHTGFGGKKVKPPRSRRGYADYLTGPGVACADGSTVEGVGQITMGCGHADTNLGYRAAAAHYDGGSGAVQTADVRAGQDDFGPWIAGALRPGLTAEQVREFRALSLSGDWREIGGHLEMVAVLAVPVPGFPVRRSLAASAADLDRFEGVRMGLDGTERVTSLVAAGRVRRVDPVERIAALEGAVARLTDLLRPMALDFARRRLDGS